MHDCSTDSLPIRTAPSDLRRATLDLEMSEDHNLLTVWAAEVNPSKSKHTTVAGLACIWHFIFSKTKIPKIVF